MRFTLSKLSSGLVLALLTALLLLAPGGATQAQSASRSFQMALWTDPSLGNGDIRTFYFAVESQPAQGPTVLIGYEPWYNYAQGNVGGVTIDWSRVVAVQIDEPYNAVDGSLHVTSRPDCGKADFDGIKSIDTSLAQRAVELKALSPKARFWVNFTSVEADWIVFCDDPGSFNRAYIDVISEDRYDQDVNFAFYSVVGTAPAKVDQQMALIPGVFSAPNNQLPYLQGYFDYANNANLSCNLPLGSRGVTGIFDGCPIWMVLGWLSGETVSGGSTYVGMLESGSGQIKTAWETELAVPLAPALAHQLSPAQIIQPILQLFLQ